MEKVSCQGNQGEGKKEAREAGSEIQGDVLQSRV